MKKHSLILFAFAAAMMASCENSTLIEQAMPESTGSIWEAEIVDDGPDTKTTVRSDGKVFWKAGDVICFVRDANKVGTAAAIQVESGGRAVFQVTGGVMKGIPSFAVHPASAPGMSISASSDKVTCEVFSNQANDFNSANISAAKVIEGSNTLRFHNLAAVFEFEVQDPAVRHIRVQAATPICGYVEATYASDGTVSKIQTTAKDHSGVSRIINIDTDGVPGKYYAAVLPGEFKAQSLSISYIGDDTSIKVENPKDLIVRVGDLVRWGNVADHDLNSKSLPTGEVFHNYLVQLTRQTKSPSDIVKIIFQTNVSRTNGLKIGDGNYMKYSDGIVTVWTSRDKFYANEDCEVMFNALDKLVDIEGLENWDTSNTTNMGQMFSQCSSLKHLDLSSFNTSNVTSMYNMFYMCEALESLDLRSFNTRKVTSVGYMFEWCYDLRQLFLGKDFVITDGCFTEETMLGCNVTVYGTTETLESFNKTLVPGNTGDYNYGGLQFAIDMGEAGWWSAWNIGAEKPSDFGRYFTWNGRSDSGHWNGGNSDGHVFSESSYTYGAAYGTDWEDIPTNWYRSLWRMPSEADINVLKKCCTVTNTTKNGVSGVLFRHKSNGNSLFFPSAGHIVGSGRNSSNTYWIADYKGDLTYGTAYDFSSGVVREDSYKAYYGMPVRPVAKFGTISATGITLDQSSLSITKGDYAVLKATVIPENAYDKSVTWSSANTDIATVTSTGKVVATGMGTTKITATNAASGMSAYCTVTVKPLNPTSFKLINPFDGSELSEDVTYSITESGDGSKYYGVKVVVTPANADYRTEWFYTTDLIALPGYNPHRDLEEGEPFLFYGRTDGRANLTDIKCTIRSMDGTVVLKKKLEYDIQVSEKQCIYVKVGTSVGFRPHMNEELFCSSGDNQCHGIFWTGDENAELDYYLHFSKPVTDIPDDAFLKNSTLKAIRLPSGVKSIGRNALYLCKNLEKVEFNEGLKTIGERAFLGNSKLNNLEFPSTLETIGIYAFSGCSSLSTIKFNEGLISIGEGAFHADTWSDIGPVDFELPHSLKEIGPKAFVDMRKTAIAIPENVRYIGSEAFNDCGRLRTVTMKCKTPPASDGNGPFGASSVMTPLTSIRVPYESYSSYSVDTWYGKYKDIMTTY